MTIEKVVGIEQSVEDFLTEVSTYRRAMQFAGKMRQIEAGIENVKKQAEGLDENSEEFQRLHALKGKLDRMNNVLVGKVAELELLGTKEYDN